MFIIDISIKYIFSQFLFTLLVIISQKNDILLTYLGALGGHLMVCSSLINCGADYNIQGIFRPRKSNVLFLFFFRT
jgi:hypothetical protein